MLPDTVRLGLDGYPRRLSTGGDDSTGISGSRGHENIPSPVQATRVRRLVCDNVSMGNFESCLPRNTPKRLRRNITRLCNSIPAPDKSDLTLGGHNYYSLQ